MIRLFEYYDDLFKKNLSAREGKKIKEKYITVDFIALT